MTFEFFTIKDLPKRTKVTPENKCTLCRHSICCTYITHQVETPRSMKDFDYLLWLVSHRNVSLFQDEDGWFLSAANPCLHLQPDGGCGIYEKRPQICREHSNDCCEFDGPAEEDYKKYFDSYASLDQYCRKKFKKWDTRFKKSEKKSTPK
ncbi:MAG TPA: YkgJ family cysteine cluster protein [Gammaproteobacteria bacterium]